MITWADKVAFVGMSVKNLSSKEYNKVAGFFTSDFDINYGYNVKVSISGGCSSFGCGSTQEEAIEDAAISFQICWSSVEQKITEQQWERMYHL